MIVTVGASELPPTVEMSVIGMQVGESKTIRVQSDEGYGPRFKELMHEIPRQNFPPAVEPKPGMLISQKIMRDGVEQKVPATIIEADETKVVIDYNHPLAGHNLTYQLRILAIDKP